MSSTVTTLKTSSTVTNTVSSTLIYWLCKNRMVVKVTRLFGAFMEASMPSLLICSSLSFR